MATSRVISSAVWTSVHTGACNIELVTGGKCRIHFGPTQPADATTDYIVVESYSREHRDDRDSYQYPYADQVWIKAEVGIPELVIVS